MRRILLQSISPCLINAKYDILHVVMNVLSYIKTGSVLFLLVGFQTIMPTVCAAEKINEPPAIRQYVRNAATHLKGLPLALREAALAEISGLLYSDSGNSVYSSKTKSETVEIRRGTKVVEKVKVPYKPIQQGARFVDSKGDVHDFYATINKLKGNDQLTQRWKLAKLYIYKAGKNAVLAEFEKELEDMHTQRGIYFLKQMAPELRAALFAEVLGLLFHTDGREVYTGKPAYSTISGRRVPYKAYRSGAQFVDAEGNTHGIAEVREKANSQGKAWRTWWPGVKLNLHCAGESRIFAAFKDEITAMKQHARK